jgi:uncharacterized protein YajQ (UPF0234 family)
MPSFDVVSEVDLQEVNNAVDQANREVTNRYDFKGTNAQFSLQQDNIQLTAEADFQLEQMQDIIKTKLNGRKIDIACLVVNPSEKSGKEVKQTLTVQQGLSQEISKRMAKLIKDSKLKVQSAIQGDKLRVTGKKRNDLQAIIALLKEAELGLPLQFNNFRD